MRVFHEHSLPRSCPATSHMPDGRILGRRCGRGVAHATEGEAIVLRNRDGCEHAAHISGDTETALGVDAAWGTGIRKLALGSTISHQKGLPGAVRGRRGRSIRSAVAAGIILTTLAIPWRPYSATTAGAASILGRFANVSPSTSDPTTYSLASEVSLLLVRDTVAGASSGNTPPGSWTLPRRQPQVAGHGR